MAIFIVFIVGAVMLGSGAMLAPAWGTAQPRIGLGATLALALVTGGAVWAAFFFGWDTLIVDYLLFALVSLVVLGGTFSQAQSRAEAKGEVLLDKDQGWTGPGDLLVLGTVAGVLMLGVLLIGLPVGNTGITLGYQTWLVGLSSQFTTYAPYFPDQGLFQPPGFIALTAYLHHQLELPIPTIQLAVGAVIAFLCVWLAYDLGSERRNKALGRTYALVCGVSGGVLVLLFSGQYTTLMATAFAFAACVALLRVWRVHTWFDIVAGALLIGATIYADFAIGSVLVLVALIGGIVLLMRTPDKTVTAGRLAIMAGVLFFSIAPWLVRMVGQPNPQFFVTGSTFWGWLIIPITIGGGELLDRILERIGGSTRQQLIRIQYPLLLGVAVALVLLVWGIAPQIRTQVPVTDNDMQALLWMRDNLAPETVLQNTRVEDWASVLCECQALVAPLPAELSMTAVPSVVYVPEGSTDTLAPATAAFAAGTARVYLN